MKQSEKNQGETKQSKLPKINNLTGVTLSLSFIALVAVVSINSFSKDREAQTQQSAAVTTWAPKSIDQAKLIRSDYAEAAGNGDEDDKGEITQLCETAMAKVKDNLKQIASMPSEVSNFENTVLYFENTLANLSDETSPLTFMAYVSPNEKLAKEGSACEEAIGELTVDIFTRRDLFNQLKGQKGRNAAEKRLLSQTLLSFKDNGLDLSDEILAQVKKLKVELSKTENDYTTNLNSDNSQVTFTKAQLDGVPEDFIANLKKDDKGLYIVTTKGTDYVALIENAKLAATRKAIQLAYLNRGGDKNLALLKHATELRAKIANLMGKKNWAETRMSTRMAESPEQVLEFLNDLKGKLAVRNQMDFDKLLKFKQETEPAATKLNQWDIGYYSYQLQKRDYSLDNETIRQYFPADIVIAGMFSTYSKILGVTYQQIKDANVWHPDVKLFKITDTSSGELLGLFYADLYPRPNKYGHAAAFPLIAGRVLEGNTYSVPIASIVANLTAPTADKPSLLTHDEVETLFHEFGHIMHQTLTRAPYASLSGASVPWDFVEAPSQMLENWVWSPKVLGEISGHYKNPQEKLPQDLLKKMIEAKSFGQGNSYTKQLLYALYDMTLHTHDGSLDVNENFLRLYKEIIGQEPLAGSNFPAAFGHLMGGYDAGYYGYLWSEVYAQDMFSKFPKDDLTNAEVGKRYRQVILEQGNMRPALDILKEFLGREPSKDAFFESIGL